MEIEINKKDEVNFSELKCGDVFEYFEDVYLKIACSYDVNNAYNLQVNIVDVFNADNKVTRLKTKLVIE